MKYFVAFALFFVNGLSLQTVEHWKTFKESHKKTYVNHLEEYERYKIFDKNLRHIKEHNDKADQQSHKKGINHFSDMTPLEFVDYATKSSSKIDSFKHKFATSMSIPSNNSELPDRVDWREANAVRPIIDQGECGSCWTFSILGALEGQESIEHNETRALSEQFLLDCSVYYGNEGCDGGLMNGTLEFLLENGVPFEKEYPYVLHDEPCKYNTSMYLVKAKDYIRVPEFDEEALKRAVATIGPIAAVTQITESIQSYSSGVFYDSSCYTNSMDHAVLIVGYGTEDGSDYWLVKNSWGTDFGEDGYIKMARNKKNHCGLASAAFYVILD